MSDNVPDTTEAVKVALRSYLGEYGMIYSGVTHYMHSAAQSAIAADRQALAEQGYVITRKHEYELPDGTEVTITWRSPDDLLFRIAKLETAIEASNRDCTCGGISHAIEAKRSRTL